jgi:uncharacterized protein (UPF0332 family)
MPENWLDVANDARQAANQLITEDRFRSCAARAYYAAYSKVTHELVLTAGLPLPPDREGFGHRRTREVILTSMPGMDQDKRDKLSELVGRLYTLRVDADYKPSTVVENREAREAMSLMKTIFESF